MAPDDGRPAAPKARPLGKRADKPAPRSERQAASRLGLSAESRAAAFLIGKGFRILARGWKSPVGEIDIVARRRQLLVFVEVKVRANLDEAAESLIMWQQHHITAAAEAWRTDNPGAGIRDLRFDAILVAPGKVPRHVEGAFEN